MSKLQVYGWLADYGGCGHYRMVFPLKGMEFEGHGDIELSTLGRFLVVRDKEEGPIALDDRWDVVVAQRTMGEGATRFFQHPLMEGVARVFELDDDLWNIHPSNQPAYDKIGAPEPQRRLRENAACADLITTTTPFLAQRIHDEASKVTASPPPIHVLGNHVPGAVLQYPVAYPESTGTPLAPVRVGWALSSSHVVDMPEVFDALRLLRRKLGADWTFETIGQDKVPQWGWKNIEVTERGWFQLNEGTYFPALDFHIGLAPLSRRLLFNQSKSDLKLVEYCSRGIPWVATDTGPYSAWRSQHGVSGFLVRGTRDWVRAITTLIRDPLLRRTMGEAGRRYVRDHRLYEDNAVHWRDAYAEVVKP